MAGEGRAGREGRLHGRTWGDTWRHQVRWARTIRVSRGIGYAGLPVTFYSDTVTAVHEGVEVVPVTDRGPAMDVAGSLLDLVGGTPMVRFDRIGRSEHAHVGDGA